MTYDLVGVSLVLILVYKVSRTGESDLVDILLDLLTRHTDTVIHKGKSLVLRRSIDIYLILLTLCLLIIAHKSKLL